MMSGVERETEIAKKLENIALICCESNWNGYGADPIPQNVIGIVKNMLPFLNRNVEIFPTANQSIQLEVDIAGEGYFECVIQKDGSIDFFIDPVDVAQPNDEQKEQLKALYTLTFRWLVKTKKGTVIAYSDMPYRSDGHWAVERGDADVQSVPKGLSICSLVSWSDTKPYDIAKALGIKNSFDKGTENVVE